MNKLIFTLDASEALEAVLNKLNPPQVFYILPEASSALILKNIPGVAPSLLINDAEPAKTLRGAESIWASMLDASLTRNALAVNIGGGVTTDIGGFAAACYMRGIRYVNIPTTLLAMVDASAGGKTGVNFNGVKNIIGAFKSPETTIISPAFLSTLPHTQLLSGYGEMLKHGLLQGEPCLNRKLAFSPFSAWQADWQECIRESVLFKDKIVSADPYEQGARRALNLGHTAGHAFESLGLGRGEQVTHGAAVAQGLVTALVLSVMKAGFSSLTMQSVAAHIKSLYSPLHYSCKDYDRLLALMHHDKKNRDANHISFTLLRAPGCPACGMETDKEEVKTALDITCDLLGI